jgi:hypothetical protein
MKHSFIGLSLTLSAASASVESYLCLDEHRGGAKHMYGSWQPKNMLQ